MPRNVVQVLDDAYRQETIYIHSTLILISFYKTFGWYPIPEGQLPKSIKDRFIFRFGEMEWCNVCPMKREARP